MTIKNFALTFALIILAKVAYSQLVINEVCISNDTITVGSGSTDDWFELYNNSFQDVNLKGWAVSDNPKKPQKYVFEDDIIINPGHYFVVLCNGLGKALNTNFKLSSDGETVVLTAPDGKETDQVSVPAMFEDRSYGRVRDGEEWAVFDEATPGASNALRKPFVSQPKLSLKGGFYKSSQKLKMVCDDPQAEIYYTTDGSVPTSKSKHYTGEITVSKTQAIRAVAVRDGYKNSPAATATFFINYRDIKIPVVCLTTDDKNFWDNRTGIYTSGTNGIGGHCDSNPHNWNQDWERDVHFEYFDEGKNLQLSVDAGVKITGTCSRDNDQKSLKITARKKYGVNRLNYKFFPQKDISEFKSIVLRSGANDWCYTKTRDPLIALTAGRNMNLDYQGYRACVVFLNGEYFGIHNIREKVSTHFVEENYGADDKEVTLLENKYSVIDGDREDYRTNVHKFAENNDLSKKENYDKIAERIDIDNFTDYWIAQIYVDNYDWPGNNIKYYKTGAQGAKWRWILFGTEYSSNLYGRQAWENSLERDLSTANQSWPPVELWSNVVMRKLLENEEFKANFIQRFSYHIDNTFDYYKIRSLSDSLKNLIDGEWNYQVERWRMWVNYWGWQNNINDMNNWYQARAGYVRQHIRDYFHLPGEYNVKAKADENDVTLFFNGYPAGNGFESRFYGGVNLKLTAKTGRRLIDYWEVEKNGQTEKFYGEELNFVPEADVRITLFTKENPLPEIPENFSPDKNAENLVINEVQPNNKGTFVSETGAYTPWIEIYNKSSETVDMAGMYLSDGKNYYMIPFYQTALTTVAPKGHIVFQLDGFSEAGALHASFTVKKDKECTLTLYQNDGAKVSEITVPELKKNQSYGCKTDGSKDLTVFVKTTPGNNNSNGKVLEELPVYTAVSDMTPVKNGFEFDIYPNPAAETVNIKSGEGCVKYALTDLQGRTLLQGFSDKIDVKDLKSGVYLIKVNGSVKKMVKK